MISFVIIITIVSITSPIVTVRGQEVTAGAVTSSNDKNSTTNNISLSCIGICGGGQQSDEVVLSNPDLTVEYNWNPRVPTCSGLSCETDTCEALERKLPSYDLTNECNKHRVGLQTAGCKCGISSGGGRASALWIGLVGTAVAAIIMIEATSS